MQYSEVRRIIQEETWKLMEQCLTIKNCPVCKASTTMLRIEIQPFDEDLEKEPLLSESKWRCMSCMNLFTEKLEQV